MATINIAQYKTLAADMQAFRPRDHHLIAEWCLDVYPLYSASARDRVRKIIINHLQGIK